MASASEGVCGVCINEFDDEKHQALILPCNHIYCSQCLRNLQASNKKNCPMCRQDWKKSDVNSLAKYGSLTESKGRKTSKTTKNEFGKNQECRADTVDDETTMKADDVLCEEHSLPYYYFCDHCKEFSCMKCIIYKQSHCTFILISDSVVLIKSDISAKAQNAKHEAQGDIDQLKKTQSLVASKSTTLKKFSHEIAALQHRLTALSQTLEGMKAKRIADLNIVLTAKSSLAKINTEKDMTMIKTCRDSLKAAREGKINSPDCSESECLLLCIADAFLDTSKSPNPDLKEENSFIKKLRDIKRPMEVQESTGFSLDDGALPDIDKATAAHPHFASGDQWVANNNSSYQAALDALTKHRPAAVLVVATGQHSEDLLMKLLDALAGVECEVKLRFLDSFYYGDDINRDNKRLGQILGSNWFINAKGRPRLTEFVGYLENGGQIGIPWSVTTLGLYCKSLRELNRHLQDISTNCQRNLKVPFPNQKMYLPTYVHVSLPNDFMRDLLRLPLNDPLPTTSTGAISVHFPCLKNTAVMGFGTLSASLTHLFRWNATSVHFPQCRLSPGGATELVKQVKSKNSTPSRIYLSTEVNFTAQSATVAAALRGLGCPVDVYQQALVTTWDIPV